MEEFKKTKINYSPKSDPNFEHKTQHKFTLLFRVLLTNNQEISLKIKDFHFEVNQIEAKLTKNGQILQNNKTSNFNDTESIIWISLRALNDKNFKENFIKIGHGELLESNLIVNYTADSKDDYDLLRSITIEDVIPNRLIKEKERICLIDPFLKDFETLVFDTDSVERIQPEDLERNLRIIDMLPKEAKTLFEIIKKFELRKAVFDAIDYSIETEGCLLNKKMKEKAGLFGNLKTTYIRVPLGNNFGNQPGQPYVLEIWPKGHSSPVHNHGNALALIKLLYGEIKVDWYNPLLSTENNPIDPKPIKTGYLKQGDITWMTALNYQTHKLMNEGHTTAISIQAYAHTDSNTGFDHSEDFEYILPGKGDLHYFRPNKDYSYKDLEKSVLEEFKTAEPV